MIDSMLYRAALPAGTYNAGQAYPLALFDGPSVVRDGYGPAHLKNVFTIASGASMAPSVVEIKNQNWIDKMVNIVTTSGGNGIYTVLSKDGPCVQRGGDVELQPNSAFEVVFKPYVTTTTTTDTDIFCLIDIDYPQVAAVANPADEKGTPVTIMRRDAVTINAYAAAAQWDTFSVDDFKAGYRYLLAQVGCDAEAVANTTIGFVKIHGAAGQNGLCTIIPVAPRFAGTNRFHLDYATPMVKGPMLISYMLFAATAGTDTATVEFDYIRR